MAYVYFSRCRPAHPMQASRIMSGVIEAEGPDDARRKLAALLAKSAGGKGLTRADDFDYLALDGIERTDHGVLAIQTVHED